MKVGQRYKLLRLGLTYTITDVKDHRVYYGSKLSRTHCISRETAERYIAKGVWVPVEDTPEPTLEVGQVYEGEELGRIKIIGSGEPFTAYFSARYQHPFTVLTDHLLVLIQDGQMVKDETPTPKVGERYRYARVPIAPEMLITKVNESTVWMREADDTTWARPMERFKLNVERGLIALLTPETRSQLIKDKLEALEAKRQRPTPWEPE